MSSNLHLNPPDIQLVAGVDNLSSTKDPAIYVEVSNPNKVGSVRCTITVSDAENGTVLDTSFYENYTYSRNIRPSIYYDISAITITVEAYVQLEETVSEYTIAYFTENVKSIKYSAISTLSDTISYVYLKAFCNMPSSTFETVYVIWEQSPNGIQWHPFDLVTTDNINPDNVPSVQCSILEPTYDKYGDVVDIENPEDASSAIYVARTAWQLKAYSPLDALPDRADIIRVPLIKDNRKVSVLYRMKMFTVRQIDAEDSAYVEGVTCTEKTILGSVVYTPVFSQQPEILESDLSNVSESKSLYNGATLYSFGNPDFKNYLVASYPGETVRPQSRLTPLDISENSYITAIVPWKNYLMCFTERTTHLISAIEDGFTASTVNTFIGIPEIDSKCCIPTLNGVIFKSNDKIYLIYPNIYAGADSVLNVTEISSFVETYLEEYTPLDTSPPFALGTDSEYILMLPTATDTMCLRYDYSSKRWTTHEYPFVATSYEMLSISDIRILGYVLDDNRKIYGEYLLDASYAKVFNEVSETQPYTDCVRQISEVSNWEQLVNDGVLQPISFAFDSGQKADTVNQHKQFVESKFSLATLHEKDSFPMRVTIHVDGCPYVTTKDINTDSAFWKESVEHLGTLNTEFSTHGSDIFNVFRQMFIRYSGKGRSVRHIIEGESLYPFKIYEINYRYRNLNVKQ